MKKFLAMAATLALALALGLSLQTPALAGRQGFMECPGPVTTGALSSVNGSSLAIGGTITPCHAPVSGDHFGIGYYNGFGEAYGHAYPYSTLNAQNQFSITGAFPDGTRAVCLLGNNITRIDCIQVTWTDGVLVVGGHLAANDPLVGGSTRLFPVGSGPYCSNGCWPNG